MNNEHKPQSAPLKAPYRLSTVLSDHLQTIKESYNDLRDIEESSGSLAYREDPFEPDEGSAQTTLFDLTQFKPHPAQWKLLDAHRQNQFTVGICGRRFGKTVTAAEAGFLASLKPNQRIWIVAPFMNLTKKSFRHIYYTYTKKMPKYARPKRASAIQGIIELPNGSEVVALSADNPASLLGEGVDLLIVDEAGWIYPHIWTNYLSAGLMDRRGKALFISTLGPSNLIVELYNKAKAGEPGWAGVILPSWENPFLREDQLAYLKNTMSEKAWNKYVACTQIEPETAALIDPETHGFVSDVDWLPGKPGYIAVDFGWANPFAAISLQRLETTTSVLAEYYKTNTLLSDILEDYIEEQINLIQYKTQVPFGGIVADSSDPSKVGELRKFLKKFGARVIKSDKKVMRDVSLEPFRNRLAQGYYRFDRKCVSLLKEIRDYSFGFTATKGIILETVEKKDDHGVDALRYYDHWIVEKNSNQRHLTSVSRKDHPSKLIIPRLNIDV